MPVERRERVIAIGIGSTGNGRNLIINGRRQPSCGDTSRMNREVHVRFCEGLGVKFPGPTRPSLPTWATQQVGSYLGNTGHAASVVAMAALDPHRKVQPRPPFRFILRKPRQENETM